MRSHHSRHHRLLSGALSFAFILGSASAFADFKDDIDFTRLRNEYGSSLPTGDGVRVVMVEYVRDNNWSPSATGELSGKSIVYRTTLFGSTSAHANNVANYLCGSTTSITSGIATLGAFEATNFTYRGSVNGGRSLAPITADWDIENHSWGGNDALHGTNILDKTDYRIERDGVISVAGVDNYSTSTMSMIMANGYNGIAVGSSSGDHARGTTMPVAGRLKPDLVGTNNFTSYATPIVSSCAALLVGEINRTPALAAARNPVAIKALLLAGATKEEFSGWSQTPTRPLDSVYGAGEVNIYNSYKMLVAGAQAPASVVSGSGWSVSTSSTSSRRLYHFTVGAGQTVKFSAVLAWNRHLAPDALWLYMVPTLNNLDLVLWRTDGAFTPTTKVTESISAIDNVEHVYDAALSAGTYALEVVSAVDGETYGLAWRGDLTAGVTPVAPTFTTHPSSQTVTTGDSVTFTAAASGTPTPSYQWKKDGSDLGGATSSSYTLSSASSADAGTYTVVATNSAGSVTSNAATLTVNPATSAPSFTVQPSAQSVVAGTSITLTATATGTPSPTYQWRKNGTAISGATSNSLTLSNPAVADSGNYSVVATNSAGSATSNDARVDIFAAPVAPSFETHPVGQSVSVGTAVTFTIALHGQPTPSIQWYKDGVALFGATSTSYSISSAALSDAGVYTAVLTNGSGSATSNNAVLVVAAANVAPSINSHPASQSATAGTHVTLTVSASGVPAPTYQWQKNGSTISGATSSSLVLSNITLSDAATYTVVVSNSLGSVTSNGAVVSVNSTASAPWFTAHPASQSVVEGASVTFTAATVGNPTPTYQWRRNGVALTGQTSNTLTLSSVTSADAGAYSLYAINSAGSATSLDATLTVTAGTPPPSSPIAPNITSQPSDLTVTANQSAVFTVSATGSPAPGYRWQRQPSGTTSWENLNNGGSYAGATSATLTIAGTTGAMSGDKFRCVAANSGGSATSNAATLTVPAPAALFQYPTSIVQDSAGALYVADASNNTIQKVVNGLVSTLAGAAGSVGSQDGTGSSARFNQPSGLAIDAAGNLYVADTGNATIRRVTPSGVVSTLAGSASSRGSRDGSSSVALFNQPHGVAVDAAGNVYVADSFNATIRLITPSGVVSTYAGVAGARGESDGTGANARFNFPTGLVIDAAGVLYVADTYNHTVRRIAAGAVVTTYAGSPGVSGNADLTGGDALFNQPYGLTIDGTGSLYVADTANDTIRRVTSARVVSTLCGVAGIAGLADGNTALFNQPRGLVVATNGSIYVCDTGNGIIRRIMPNTTVMTPTLAAAPETTPDQPTPAPNPTPTPSPAAASSGGGGGSLPAWFSVLLMALLAVRTTRRSS